ncbi:MAG: hypothetical protein AAGF89_09400 [Bacteroidota bacterium]
MTDQQLNQQLAALKASPPSVSLAQVSSWVKTGRPRPRFHALAWLSRVGWQWPN